MASNDTVSGDSPSPSPKSKNWLRRLSKFGNSLRKPKQRSRSETEPSFVVAGGDEDYPNVNNDYVYLPLERSSKYGRGVFVLITLFTGSLKGYKRDRMNLKEIFVDKMGYELFETSDCTQIELLKFLEDTRQQIERSDHAFDRLVCVVSSHGLKEGLLTCEDKSGQENEFEPGSSKPLITTYDEVIAFFKHDKLTKLKNHPKLILFQCCNGNDTVRAAACPTINVPSLEAEPLEFRQHKVPIDADFEICFASTKNNKSFVDDSDGSWFTQMVLQTLRRNMNRYHVHDMIVMANSLIAEKRKSYRYYIDDEENPKTDIAVQIPCTYSTLRKQFWLEHAVPEVRIKHGSNNTYVSQGRK